MYLVRLDYLETNKKAIEDLEVKLRNNSQDELSKELIDTSKKLSEYRLAELKAKRDVNLFEQKEEYHQRLIRQQTERMKVLEEELASWEVKHAQREDFWRKRYNDQMALIFGKPGDNAGGLGGDNVPKEVRTRKDAAYLTEVSGKNVELRDLKQKLEEYQKLVDDKNDRIKILEESLTRLEQRKAESSLPYIDNTKNIIKEAYNDEEAKKFAYAAQKTIQTLHEIVEDKNKQLQRKDEMLKKIREESMHHKNHDAEEIQRLNLQIETLMKEAANGNNAPGLSRSVVDSAMIGKISANEVEHIMLEKDRKLERFNQEIQNLFQEKKTLSENLKQVQSL